MAPPIILLDRKLTEKYQLGERIYRNSSLYPRIYYYAARTVSSSSRALPGRRLKSHLKGRGLLSTHQRPTTVVVSKMAAETCSITHATNWLITSSFNETRFPASSLGGLMSKVAKSDAASRNSMSLLKWKPGQILGHGEPR